MIINKKIRISRAAYRKQQKETLTTDRPYLKLTKKLKRKYGRNGGQISVRHQFSGGHRKLYRVVSITRKVMDVEGVVETVEYDPFRNAYISLIGYKDGQKEYVIHVEGMKVGDSIINSASASASMEPGCSNVLANFQKGAIVCCVCYRPGSRTHIARAAGTYATVVDNHSDTHTLVTLPSGTKMKLPNQSQAVSGKVSNSGYKNLRFYKAGQMFHRGVRPTVRGKAMNPIDHGHGGGEGNTGTKRNPVSYKYKPAKGGRTMNKRSKFSKYIVERRPQGK